jgi:hypothetical protein
MVRWPAADRMSKVSASIVERFKKTSEAKDLEQDAREWVLSSWPWMPDAPYPFIARSTDGSEQRNYLIDDRDTMTVRVSSPTNNHAA